MRTGRGALARVALVLAGVGLVVASCAGGSGDQAAPGTTIAPTSAVEAEPVQVPGRPATGVRSASGLVLETTSTFPEYVTGGDVAVRVAVPEGTAATPVLTANGAPVALEATDEPGTYAALVTGLPEGRSELVAALGDEQLRLEVTDHPVTGPLFSGPHLEPFACTTEAAGLGAPLDDDCLVAPVTTTRTVEGEAGPIQVTTERGTINRGIYELHVPEGWNGRLVYRFGGGCGTTYSQGSNLTPAFDETLLAQGYALAANTLTTFQVACNDVLSAETALMVTERFAELVGPPELVIGDGGSGGAIQQLLIAQNYPGILDGITPSLPFPDAITIAAGITDCGLLLDWYADEGAALSDAQRAAIDGHAVPGTCEQWARLFLPGIDPTVGCALPDDLVYDPETNPDGARCTLQDSNVNLLGTDPATGFARRPLDNVGVQYGLEALLAGTIDAETFVALNEGIGGYDVDGTIVDERHRADEGAVEAAYATGRVLSGSALAASATPILATTTYLDDRGDIHDRFRIYSVRARMQDAGADPTLLAVSSQPGRGSTIEALTGGLDAGGSAVVAMDRLLSQSGDGQRVVMTDTCNLPDGTQATSTDATQGACAEAYPMHGDPRTAAGAPLANDVLKCSTRAPQPQDYPGVTFTDAQWDRLVAAFADGVCDWTAPGVGQVPLAGTWQRFGE